MLFFIFWAKVWVCWLVMTSSVQSLQHWCSLDVVLQIIKSLIKLMGLIAVVYILLILVSIHFSRSWILILIIYSIIISIGFIQSSLSSFEALSLSILYGFRQFGPPRHAQKKVHGNCPKLENDRVHQGSSVNFPKGASLVSSGFLISTFHRYKNCRKTLWGRQNPVHPLYCWTIETIRGHAVGLFR